MSYVLPQSLEKDIQQFASLAKEYQEKKIDIAQFKAVRVPMGIYEQRKDEIYMARIRTTGGVISPKQLLEVIEIAKNYHSNLLHITTRQEIQIQNLLLENVEPIMQALRKIGLATKGGGGNTIRNILVSEYSGISDNEEFDTTPYAMALTSKLIAEADSYLMPRKMKMAFSSDDKQIGYAAINDVGFVAKTKNGEKGFLVYAGGGAGAKPTIGWILFDFIPASELYVVAEALKRFFSEHGNRKNRSKARLRFVFYKLGEEETIRLIKEYYEAAKKVEPPFIPQGDENERPSFSYQPIIPNQEDEAYKRWKDRYVEAQKQDGYSTVLLPILLGNIFLDEKEKLSGLIKLLTFIDRFGEHTLRFTNSQSIRLRNIPDQSLPELYQIIKEFIPDVSASFIINNIISCTGADTCRLGIGLSKELAKAIRRELLRSDLDLDHFHSTHIRISGCPNSCGLQLWGDIGFSGKVLRSDRIYPGYQVYLAARRNDPLKFAEPIGNISSRDIPKFIINLFKAYSEVSKEYKSFSDYLETEGKEKAKQLIEQYKTIPSFADDKNYYFDWGAETIFSIVGRGSGECAAGLFDMLEIDNNIIKNTKAALPNTTDPEKRNNLLYDIIFSSSRMLLATRGADPKTTNDVFNLFVKNFIEYGFVEDKFRPIIELARDNKKFDFNSKEDLIYQLADRVINLYQSLDDSLQLKNVALKK